jgi:hypothetical protein
MSTGLCLVTRGYICVPRTVEVVPLVSCKSPTVKGALEIRPRVRTIVYEPDQPAGEPVPVAASELRPIPRGASAPSPPDPDPRPVPTVVIELKPEPKKAEED